jgi:hypothetical protein
LFVVVGAGIAFAAGHGTRLLTSHNDVQYVFYLVLLFVILLIDTRRFRLSDNFIDIVHIHHSCFLRILYLSILAG